MEKTHQNSSSNKIPAAPPSDCSRSLFTMQANAGVDDLKSNNHRHPSGLKQKPTLSSNTNSSSTLNYTASSLNTSVALNQSHIPVSKKNYSKLKNSTHFILSYLFIYKYMCCI